MRKLKNTEIANYVFEEIEKMDKEYEVEFSKILQMVDDSIENDDDFDKDEYGEIANEMSEEEIVDLKQKMLNGIEEYFNELNSRD